MPVKLQLTLGTRLQPFFEDKTTLIQEECQVITKNYNKASASVLQQGGLSAVPSMGAAALSFHRENRRMIRKKFLINLE